MYKENYPSRLLEEAVDAINMLPGVGKRSALRLALHLLRQPQDNVHHFTAAINNLRDNVKYCRHCRMISDGDVCSICSDMSRDRNTICVVESVRDVMSIENTGQYHGLYHVLGGIISPINGIGPSDLTIRELVSRVAALCGRGADGGAAAEPGDAGAAETRQGDGDMATEPGAGRMAATGQAGNGTAAEPSNGRAVNMRQGGDGAAAEQSGAGAAGTRQGDAGKVEVILALSGDVEGETTSFYIYRQLAGFGVTVSSLARGLGFGDDLEYADELTLGRSIANRQIFHP